MRYHIILPALSILVMSCAKKETSSSSSYHHPASTTHNTSSNTRNTNGARNASYRETVVSTATMNSDIINGINAYRKTRGLAPLRLLAMAASEAGRHSSNMASKRIPFGHDGFNQRAINIANELHGTSATGENVAFGKMTWKQVIDAWLRSPDHKANIEGNFNYTGVGVAKDSRGVVYYTQIFVAKRTKG